MKDFASTFARIIKTDKNADGTLTVYGKATDDTVDSDQQICDNAWLSKAMPDWFMTGGNIREQHSNIAAGVAKEYEQKSDGHYIQALVVDPTSVKKVETGVLKGFSIGIRAPRVVRDNKALNGRIIDGQIVEVSLVDRPANPNAKLLLAKSVEGVSSLVKTEELTMKTASEIVAEAKALVPTATKFDAAQYDAARRALAALIVTEANEMAEEGHNEEASLSHLLAAVSHLFAWYEGEEAEGEVMEESIEMSAATDDPLREEAVGELKAIDEEASKPADAEEEKADGEICPECGLEKKMCKCNMAAKELVDENGQEETSKSITEILPPTHIETLPSVSPETIEEFTEEDSVSKTLLANLNINEIIEKAVKSAMASVTDEVAILKSAKEAVEEKALTLETELATAKSLAVGGGPKRSAIATGQVNISEMKVKADYYLAKSSQTTDRELSEGYKQIAKDYLAKASAPETSNSLQEK